ncbi:TPA: polysaccharide deacetylase family protein [Pseudomonas aeruginosa]|uniref:Polysaccharide deacetylase family protein n=2 Tax=Pseudomonas aeruginosa group TaxID=136841 RepID=A0ABD7JZ28_PSEAI|nr:MULTISPECIES: hypothetical protein [Pseudomonas aeruginosa group]ABR83857.1 polysaccharide deacetylase family protein [Pseudomonas aeruginosa PA7]KJC23126.1 hypothetical protein TN45_15220 [Pseudomonas aeruginosa]KSC42384.1 hypothetical protein AO882_21185 [Pseudomonas paraeruginosa]KSC87947.1 hypothetical protein AO896_16100 [Pseudomonas aeruginosa]KSD20668.1 hypothetical protein AO898_14605 [Pseudomonas aeruginosa]
MQRLIGMTYLNSAAGQRRLRQNGIVLRLGRLAAEPRLAALPHRQGRCLERRSLENLLLWLQRHFLCVPLEHLLERPSANDLRIALSLDGSTPELVEQVYPLLERYEMPASVFLGGDPRGWREAVGDTLWQADTVAAAPLLELLQRYCGPALAPVLERTRDDVRRSRHLAALLGKLERLDPASRQALRAACPPADAQATPDWGQLRRLENSGLVRFGLYGQGPQAPDSFCAEPETLGHAHRLLQQQCNAPLPVYCRARPMPGATQASPQLRASLGRLGYRFAFGARRGLVDSRGDPLDLPRIEVDAAIAARPGRLAWQLYRGVRA